MSSKPTVPGIYRRTWIDLAKSIERSGKYIVFKPGPRKELQAVPADGHHSPMHLDAFQGEWTLEVAA